MMPNEDLSALRINEQRLWLRLMEMAQIGATVNDGCNRQALTDLDMAGRALLSRWATAAGCAIRTDAIGNMFVRRAGADPDADVVMSGSHLDTQPTGGKFDGVYGVLAGLEVIECLNEHRVATHHPIEVCVWCNEEGSRFPMAMMGSAVWAGRLPLDKALALADRSGITVGSELRRLNFSTVMPPRQAVKAAFEVHIEQGPVLEQTAATIGVVNGVQHMSRHEILIEGQEAHAGPTPMDLRRDPIRALADLLPTLYKAAQDHGKDARFTVGFIETLPGSPNTVPGLLRFTADIRHPEAASYDSLKATLNSQVQAVLRNRGLKGSVRCVWEAPGVTFAAQCIAAVRGASAKLGFKSIEMVSGAGHDSCNVAAVVPTAMVFVPCAGGLSHNEAESAAPADLAAGANVLLHAIVSMARP
jgi:beta-ureidopropionase / N-carbamoyl-L-amino-acid hydrolase